MAFIGVTLQAVDRHTVVRLLLAGAFILCGLNFPAASAGEVTIAVATNFALPMKEIAAEFERFSGHTVISSYASSGKFHAQILHGAPFDVFFSADQATPLALEQAGLAVVSSRFTYAVGGLVLWSRHVKDKVPLETRLQRGEFNKLALANPKLAPYGAAAVQVMRRLGVLDQTRDLWVLGENIAQAYQFVSTGNADLGFVARSQLRATQNGAAGTVWRIPKYLYDPIRQDAVLLRRGEHNGAAHDLIQFIQGDIAASILLNYGYEIAAHSQLDESRYEVD